jgi:hypothetical protein
MGILATGQITFIAYNDALSLTGLIKSSAPKTQVYDTSIGGAYNYTPSWTSTPLVLTPTLSKQAAGSAGVDLVAVSGGNGANISNVKWKIKLFNDAEVEIAKGTSNASFGSVSSSAPYALTLNKNVMTSAKPAMEVSFTCTYTDPSTSLSIDFASSISLSLMKSGGKAVFIQMTEQNGQYFIRNGAVDTTTMKLLFKVFRNGVEDTAVTGSAQWKYRDPGGSWTNDGSAIALSGTNPSTVATKTISAATINAIHNSRVYRVEFTDNDSDADKTGTVYSDELTIIDLTDPYTLEYTVSGGTIFKNGEGSKTVYPRLFQNGVEVDLISGAYKLYRFTLYDSSGNITYFKSAFDLSTTVATAISAGGKSLAIASAGTAGTAKAIAAGDELVLEPGVSGKEEIVTVADTYTSGTTIPLVNGVTYSHAVSAVVKSANKKTGLTDTTKLITVTGVDITNLGSTSVEAIG